MLHTELLDVSGGRKHGAILTLNLFEVGYFKNPQPHPAKESGGKSSIFLHCAVGAKIANQCKECQDTKVSDIPGRKVSISPSD